MQESLAFSLNNFFLIIGTAWAEVTQDHKWHLGNMTLSTENPPPNLVFTKIFKTKVCNVFWFDGSAAMLWYLKK